MRGCGVPSGVELSDEDMVRVWWCRCDVAINGGCGSWCRVGGGGIAIINARTKEYVLGGGQEQSLLLCLAAGGVDA